MEVVFAQINKPLKNSKQPARSPWIGFFVDKDKVSKTGLISHMIDKDKVANFLNFYTFIRRSTACLFLLRDLCFIHDVNTLKKP